MKDFKENITSYAADRLTVAQLELLREQSDAATDQKVGQVIEELWCNGSIVAEQPPVGAWDRIAQQIGAGKQHKPRIPRWVWGLQAASVAAILVLGVALLYFHNNQTLVDREQPIVVATELGQRAVFTLPDGTVVRLNPESSVSYVPAQFGRSERRVAFVGDAFFDVAKHTNKPFLIYTQGAWVRVLGTRFSFSALAADSLVSIGLEQGKVWFGAESGASYGVLEAGQKGVLNRHTHRLTIGPMVDSVRWGYGKLEFRRATLDQVAAAMGKHYGVRVSVSELIQTRHDRFSGTLPTDDVFDAIRVLERAYDIPANRVDVDIRLQAGR